MNLAFYMQMKNSIFLILTLLLLFSATSCKKVCYQCNQYCAYCQLKSDSSIIYQVCTNKFGDHNRIDSIEAAFGDTTWVCNLQSNQVNVCDGKNNIDQGITYYEQENYFCTPQ